MSDIDEVISHVTHDTFSELIDKGYMTNDLEPCEDQGRDGSCLKCPGKLKKVPGCGWNFHPYNDYNGNSKVKIQLYRIVSNEPDMMLELPL